MRQIRFRFDGQPINESDTPAQVNSRRKAKELHLILTAGVDASLAYEVLV